MTDLPNDTPRPNPAARPAGTVGQWLYGGLAFAVALFLLASIPFQTSYFEGVPWYKQPRTWPSIAIIGMLLAGLGHFGALSRFQERDDALPLRDDLSLLAGAFQISLWFLLYIFAVGVFGYLPSSLAFAVFMVWKAGYTDARMYLYAALLSVAIVVVFKGFLKVNIPGGDLYNHLPEAMQRFAKLYL